jgi:hypothetical protein
VLDIRGAQLLPRVRGRAAPVAPPWYSRAPAEPKEDETGFGLVRDGHDGGAAEASSQAELSADALREPADAEAAPAVSFGSEAAPVVPSALAGSTSDAAVPPSDPPDVDVSARTKLRDDSTEEAQSTEFIPGEVETHASTSIPEVEAATEDVTEITAPIVDGEVEAGVVVNADVDVDEIPKVGQSAKGSEADDLPLEEEWRQPGTWEHHLLCVIDPFIRTKVRRWPCRSAALADPSQNLTGSISKAGIGQFIAQCQISADMLAAAGNIDDFLVQANPAAHEKRLKTERRAKNMAALKAARAAEEPAAEQAEHEHDADAPEPPNYPDHPVKAGNDANLLRRLLAAEPEAEAKEQAQPTQSLSLERDGVDAPAEARPEAWRAALATQEELVRKVAAHLAALPALPAASALGPGPSLIPKQPRKAIAVLLRARFLANEARQRALFEAHVAQESAQLWAAWAAQRDAPGGIALVDEFVRVHMKARDLAAAELVVAYERVRAQTPAETPPAEILGRWFASLAERDDQRDRAETAPAPRRPPPGLRQAESPSLSLTRNYSPPPLDTTDRLLQADLLRRFPAPLKNVIRSPPPFSSTPAPRKGWQASPNPYADAEDEAATEASHEAVTTSLSAKIEELSQPEPAASTVEETLPSSGEAATMPSIAISEGLSEPSSSAGASDAAGPSMT